MVGCLCKMRQHSKASIGLFSQLAIKVEGYIYKYEAFCLGRVKDNQCYIMVSFSKPLEPCRLVLNHYDGTYTMKKVRIQNTEQLELVSEEIRVFSLFSHPNLLPLLDHAIISVKISNSLSIPAEVAKVHAELKSPFEVGFAFLFSPPSSLVCLVQIAFPPIMQKIKCLILTL
ncbi:uncharacterized protein LOC126712882 isoform X2 [Quercus robur]|uniref:uncharacterized protein LOC126712882 isoform X2 n=2 Tax=Quercus robur TaxID=38942 RepID=UPI00216308DA|nr:uncharacterized protein LOC126712882 isoform X2 [Quercus robur]